MSLNSRYVNVGSPIRAARHNEVVEDLNAIAKPSPYKTRQSRWLFEQTKRREKFYGTTTGAWETGTLELQPCFANGVTNGEDPLNVNLPTEWGTVNLGEATIAGVAEVAVTCELAEGTLLQYAYGADGNPYLVGVKPVQVQHDMRLDSGDIEVKVQWLIGTGASTVSDWMPAIETEESEVVPCEEE